MADANAQQIKEAPPKRTAKKLEPLKVRCTSSNCDSGLHCFLASRKMLKENRNGQCRSCGISLIDWKRIHQHNVNDVGYTFSSLKKELVRHHFWHLDIDIKASNHARRKGKSGMVEAIDKRIKKYLAPAEPPFDGRQTPKSGNSIFYAQHATGTCCRKCVQEWHGVNKGVELSPEQVSYFSRLIMLFIEERLPYLTEHGEKIPSLSR